MQPVEYDRMKCFESWYWWYRARRHDLISIARRLTLPATPRILDVGCGSGMNVTELARSINASGFGLDVSQHASRLWQDGEFQSCLGSANELPYEDNSFDLVMSADVIGCEGVSAERSISEMQRVVRTGGYLVLFAPAFQWLRSRHDVAVHSVRRFTRDGLQSMVQSAGFNVVRSTYRFFAFFPLIAMVRLCTKPFAKANSASPRSDLFPIPDFMNRILLTFATWEQAALGQVAVPFGTTVLIVARKGGSV